LKKEFEDTKEVTIIRKSKKNMAKKKYKRTNKTYT